MRLAPLACVVSALLSSVVLAEGPVVALSGNSLLLGSGATLEATVTSLETGTVFASASVGTFRRLGPLRFEYRPPSEPYPQVALLVFWSEGHDASPPLTIRRVNLIGRTELEATTAPGAKVQIRAAGKLFGPVIADQAGTTKMQLMVPPGLESAEVIADFNGKQVTRTVPLGVPKVRARVVAVSSQVVRGETGWAVVFEEGGEPGTPPLELEIEGGAIERVQPDRYELSPDGDAREMVVSVKGGGPRYVVEVLGPPRISHGDVGITFGPIFAGAGLGLFATGVVALNLPPWPDYQAELSLGAKQVTVRSESLLAQSASTRVQALTAELALRALLLGKNKGPRLVGRLGGGLVPFLQQTSSVSFAPFGESGLGFDAFLALQGAWRFGSIEPFAELKGTLSPIRTSRLNAETSAFSAALGVRFLTFY